MRITSIKVGERHRRAMGDIASLEASIRDLGLLHPIVVSARGDLIVGARRLEACRQLGWTWIPARVVDLDDPLQAELDENTVRKDFTPSEIAAIARAMREREEEAARERQAEAGRIVGSGQASAKFAEASDPDAGEVRAKIAARTGVSREQVRKIEKVVEAAEREPEVFAPLVEEMDATGKVDAAYQAVRRVEAEREAAESASESLAEHRWHWTLDESNRERVTVSTYARAIGKAQSTVFAQVNGYAAYRGTSIGTLSEAIERANIGAERQAVTDAVADARGVGTTGQRQCRICRRASNRLSEARQRERRQSELYAAERRAS